MNDTKKVIVCLIKNEKKEYLFVRLADYSDHEDEWCPVAGHIKPNESQEEAISREIKEKLGVVAIPYKFISEWKQDVAGEVAFWWEVKINGKIFIDKNEISEYGWFSSSQLKSMKLWPSTEKFFRKFIWK